MWLWNLYILKIPLKDLPTMCLCYQFAAIEIDLLQQLGETNLPPPSAIVERQALEI